MKWFLLLVQPAKFELPLTPKSAAGAHRKKLVARRSLREHVYKRVGAASVTFCGRGKRSVRKSPAKSEAFKVQRSLLRRGMGGPNRTMQRNVIK